MKDANDAGCKLARKKMYCGKKMIKTQILGQGLPNAAKFLLRFFASFFVLQIFIWAVDTSFVENFYTQILGQIFQLETKGNILMTGNGTLNITKFCLGLFSVSLLGAAMFVAKPENTKSWTRTTQVKLFAIGSATLLAANFLRLSIVVFSALKFGFGFADTLHVFSWFLMSAIAIGIWYFSQ